MPVNSLFTSPNVATGTPAGPTGTASLVGVHAGLAIAFTPQLTGRLLIIITMNATNSTAAAGDGAKAQIRHGTGAAPANGAALAGTADGPILSTVLERATASDLQALTCVALITGLVVGTQYWIDLSETAIVGGTAVLSNIGYAIIEI